MFKRVVHSGKPDFNDIRVLLFFFFFLFRVAKDDVENNANADANALSRRGWCHDTGRESVIWKPNPRPLRSSLSRIVTWSEVGVASPTLDFKRHPFSFYYLSFLSARTNYSTSTETNPSSLSRDPIAQNCSPLEKKMNGKTHVTQNATIWKLRAEIIFSFHLFEPAFHGYLKTFPFAYFQISALLESFESN